MVYCCFTKNFFSFVVQSKNKVSLRNLSMVLRQLNVSAEQRGKNIEESVEKAKEAVQMDIKDGMSWCKYGVSYFVNHPFRERSGSVVECLTRDRGAAGSSLTGVTALWSLSKTHLS